MVNNPSTSQVAPTLMSRLAVQSFFDKPLAISETGLAILLRVAELTAIPATAHIEYADTDDSRNTTYAIQNGIALISIEGPLLRNNSYISKYLGLTTYETITRKLVHCLNNPHVKGILLDVDSPGGESSGCADLTDLIFHARNTKPIFAVANDSAYSAAYWIASAATKLFATRDAGCGSIGCYMAHLDRSGFDKQQGFKFTYIFAGKHKVDGNPHEPLSKDAKSVLQREVDRVRDVFAASVARNRNVDAQAIYDTESGVSFAHACLPLLADEVGSRDDCLRALITHCGGDPDDPSVDYDYASPDDHSPTPAALHSGGSVRDAIETAVISRMLASVPSGYVLAQPGVNYRPDERVAIPVVRRSVINTTVDNSRKISMLVVPYNSPSTDLGGFREVYSPGCFSDGGLDADPCVFLNHDETLILGRQSSNARFYDAGIGIRCDCDLPNVSYADDLLVLMRQKIITQSSAGFWILRFHWEERNGQRYRVIDKALLREAAPVSIPAYKSSTATVQPG